MAKQETTEVATQQPAQVKGVRKSSDLLAEHLHLEVGSMINIIKAQCFKSVRPDQISNEMLAAYVNVALSLKEQAPNFNPLLPGMLYAYPSKNGGIECIIGPDCVFAMLGSRSDVIGVDTELEYDEKGNLISCLATIEVTGKRPYKKRVFLHEWKVDSNPNWKARPSHMLEVRGIKQCGRYIIHGIPFDAEEIEIIEGHEAAKTPAKVALEPGQSRTQYLMEKVKAREEEPPAVEAEYTEAPPVTDDPTAEEPDYENGELPVG
jgi:hypothetical protein